MDQKASPEGIKAEVALAQFARSSTLVSLGMLHEASPVHCESRQLTTKLALACTFANICERMGAQHASQRCTIDSRQADPAAALVLCGRQKAAGARPATACHTFW